MQARVVAAARGASWLADGWQLFRVAPLSWLALVFAYWLLMTLASLLPVVGVVAASVLVPPFSVGFMAAARAAERGGAVELGLLFDGFRNSAPSQLALGVVYLAVLNLALGGALSFVLIQEKLAPLLSDTFFVPGYFHFLTVGTVTLSFLAALLYILPALTGRALWRPQLLRWMPHLATAGLLLFGGAGVTAGYLGVPRRVLNAAYDGAAPAPWPTLMSIVGIGATLMAAALVVYLYALLHNLVPAQRRRPGHALPEVRWGGATATAGRAWTGPLAVLVLLALTVGLTAIAFELLRGLPLAAAGSVGH